MIGKHLTVTELTDQIRNCLEGSFTFVHVEGELSNCRPASSGHLYFSLKDSGAKIDAVMFKHKLKSLNFEPKDGMLLRVRGSLSVYAPRGTYSIVCDEMEAAGAGEILALLEKRKQRLAAEGLFDMDRKRPLPRFPKVVGVVSSPTGAAVRDILNILARRAKGIKVIILPAVVQGDEAGQVIAARIRQANQWQLADVLIVGRGGGSIEDLWAFNEEVVARAIASSAVPVISAVGHETDFTIADFAADKRAPTPSAAAEIALPDRNEEIRHIDMLALRLGRSVRSVADSMRNRFRVLDAKLSPKRASETVGRASAVLSELSSRASSSLRSHMARMSTRFSVTDARLSPRRAKEAVDQYMMRLDDLSVSADILVQRRMSDSAKDLNALSMRLDSLNPSSVIGRGYAIIRKGEVTITSVSGVRAGDGIEILMRGGSASAEVRKVKQK